MGKRKSVLFKRREMPWRFAAICMAGDILLVVLSCLASVYLRYDGDIPRIAIDKFHSGALPILIIYAVLFLLFGLPFASWRYSSLRDKIKVTLACFIAMCVTLLLNWFCGWLILRSILVLVGIMSMLLMLAVRYGYYALCLLVFDRKRKPVHRALIVGTGDEARRTLHLCRNGELWPDGICRDVVAYADNDPAKLYRSYANSRVACDLTRIPSFVVRKEIGEIMIATRALTPRAMGQLVGLCFYAKRRVYLYDEALENDSAPLSVLRRPDMGDLLGQRVGVETEKLGLFDGRVVAVIGAGALGFALVRELRRLRTARILVLDGDAGRLRGVRAAWDDHRIEVRPCDWSDAAYRTEIFSETKPDFVFDTRSIAAEDLRRVALHDLPRLARATVGAARYVRIACGAESDAQKRLLTAERLIVERAGGIFVEAPALFEEDGEVLRIIATIKAGAPVRFERPARRALLSARSAARLALNLLGEAKGGAAYSLQPGTQAVLSELAENIVRYLRMRPGWDILIKIEQPHDALEVETEKEFPSYREQDAPVHAAMIRAEIDALCTATDASCAPQTALADFIAGKTDRLRG